MGAGRVREYLEAFGFWERPPEPLWRRLFNPSYWIGHVIGWIADLPFRILRRAGFDTDKAEASTWGKTVKAVRHGGRHGHRGRRHVPKELRVLQHFPFGNRTMFAPCVTPINAERFHVRRRSVTGSGGLATRAVPGIAFDIERGGTNHARAWVPAPWRFRRLPLVE